ncbi:hypothetical protein [Haloarchaeobius sp. DFWS5]|uniref:hypothetical protein n=1 Tax=Haloarchaeobius sp. DFWS5 TaxID=3446114 RepID=UPI003EB8CE75
MPGTPEPSLGSQRANASTAAVLTVALLLPAVLLRDAAPAVPLALGIGLLYAVVLLAVWAAARYVADDFVWDLRDDPRWPVALVSTAWVVLGLQAAIPAYGYVRWGLVVPLLVLALVTWFLTNVFLGVRGESDPIGLYVLYGPMVTVGLLVLGGLELVARHGVSLL